MRNFKLMLVIGVLTAFTLVSIPTFTFYTQSSRSDAHEVTQAIETQTEPDADHKVIKAYVTGYNTVPEQTDNTPCIAANGNICGRKDTVACPANIELGTNVWIRGKKYECMDRTHPKHDGRFDISCDKDMRCPYEVTGYAKVVVQLN